jgi:hypothetical protein
MVTRMRSLSWSWALSQICPVRAVGAAAARRRRCGNVHGAAEGVPGQVSIFLVTCTAAGGLPGTAGRKVPGLSLPGILDYVVDGARERRETMRQLATCAARWPSGPRARRIPG